jgi:hypothetical protein
MQQWAWDALRQLWTFVVVALVVYQGGLVSKSLATRAGWRAKDGDPPTWFDLSMRFMPLLVGGLFGLLPLPTLDAIDQIAEPGTRVLTRVAWFTLAGALCGQVYEASRFALSYVLAYVTGHRPPTLDTTVALEPGDPSGGSERP